MNTNNPSYLVYAGLLVSLAAKYGIVFSQSNAVSFVAIIAAIIGSIWAHYTVKKVAGIAKGLGASNIK